MSTTIPESTASNSVPPAPGASPTKTNEIKLISHSNLFYWWPVWLLAFFMATWTYFEGNRLAIVPPQAAVKNIGGGQYLFTIQDDKGNPIPPEQNHSINEGAKLSEAKLHPFAPRVSAHYSLGTLFVIVLILTIVITNVPMRGLWSFLVLMFIMLLAVSITLFDKWDVIFKKFDDLHIYINMAGYLFIGCAVFGVWAMATWVFDRRAYVIFTPGQVKVCEHIGASVQTYPTMGISMTKQRDDLFRHYILGFGSGDLVLTLSSGEKREIRLPNILGISWRLKPVEDMLRTMSTT